MDLHLRLIAVLVALIATSILTGAGWYEQAVLDTAWPKHPAIVRPKEGGANRKFFWVPANIFGVASVFVALVACWPVEAARWPAIAAATCLAAINAVTVVFFAPAVLKVEKDGVNAGDPSSIRWVRLSRLRTPLALGVNLGLVVATLALAS
jgi:hypothetical protein